MSATAIDVPRIAGHIGAEITGIAIGPDLTSDIVQVIRDTLCEHKVVYFRGQDHLDDAAQAGFGRLFGELTTAHPTVPGTKDDRHVFELDAQAGGGKANAWHTDVTFVDRPPAISILRAVTLPPYGGDTAWANTVTAYASLSPALRAFAENLWALTRMTTRTCSPRRSTRGSTRWCGCTRRRGTGAAARPVRPPHPGRLGERLALICSTCSSST